MKFKKLSKLLFLSSMMFAVSCCVPEIVNVVRNIANNTSVKKSDEHNGVKVKVTYDANGGEFTGGHSEITITDTVKFKEIKGSAPTVKRDNQKDPGWYYMNGNNKIVVTDETTFSSNVTLKANWAVYKLTFHAGNGHYRDGSKYQYINDSGSIKTVVHPEDLERPLCEGKVFSGWSDGNEVISFPYYPTKDLFLTAVYADTLDITVACFSGEGSFKENGNKVYYLNHVPTGSSWGTIKEMLSNHTPDIEGDKTFDSWLLNGNPIRDYETFSSSIIVTAKYCDAIQITFDAQNGHFTDGETLKKSAYVPYSEKDPHSFSDYIDSAYTEPPVLTEEGTYTYDLLGWFDNPNADGDQILPGTKITNKSSFRVYACYKKPYHVELVGDNVTIDGMTSFVRKDTVEFRIRANKGYRIDASKVSIEWGGIVRKEKEDYTLEYVVGGIKFTIKDAPSTNIKVTCATEVLNYWVVGRKAEGYVESILINDSAESSVKVPFNSTVKIKINPVLGYEITGFKIYSTDYTASLLKEFNVAEAEFLMEWDKDIEIVADYREAFFKVVDKSDVEKVSVVIDGGESHQYKSQVTIHASAKEHYDLEKVLIKYNGQEKELDLNYTVFEMPQYDVEVYAIVKLHNYKITWMSEDKEVLVNYATHEEVPTPPSPDPTKESDPEWDYQFECWKNKDTGEGISKPSSDTVYVAQYTKTKRKYIITFETYDHEEIEGATQEIEYGGMPVEPTDYASYIPAADEKYSYTWKGWDKPISEVKDNTNYVATYTSSIRSYNITFFTSGDDETIFETKSYNYGATPTCESVPTKTHKSPQQYKYIFAGWANTKESEVVTGIQPVTGEQSYYPVFTEVPITYTIQFYSEDGNTLLQEKQELYGETPVYYGETPTKETSTRATYVFDGWSETKGGEKIDVLSPVTGNAKYYAHFDATPIKYRLSFNGNGGKIIKGGIPISYMMVDCGELLTDALNGVSPSHEYANFKGWSLDGSTVYDISSVQMPDSNLDLIALWQTYNITVENVAGAAGKATVTEFNDVLEVHTDDMKIEIEKEGYILDGFEYSINESTYAPVESMPFRPYAYGASSGATIKLRPKFKLVDDYVFLHLDGNGGTFYDGEYYTLTIRVKKGLTLGEIKANPEYKLPTEVKVSGYSLSITGWYKSDYTTLYSDSDVINEDTFMAAQYLGA